MVWAAVRLGFVRHPADRIAGGVLYRDQPLDHARTALSSGHRPGTSRSDGTGLSHPHRSGCQAMAYRHPHFARTCAAAGVDRRSGQGHHPPPRSADRRPHPARYGRWVLLHALSLHAGDRSQVQPHRLPDRGRGRPCHAGRIDQRCHHSQAHIPRFLHLPPLGLAPAGVDGCAQPSLGAAAAVPHDDGLYRPRPDLLRLYPRRRRDAERRRRQSLSDCGCAIALHRCGDTRRIATGHGCADAAGWRAPSAHGVAERSSTSM